MLTVVAFVLYFVASTLAYQVTFPNANSGWTNIGSQFVNWTMVDTDPPNVTIVLTNQQLSGFTSEVLIALAVGLNGYAIVNPPSGEFQVAADYRVNLVKDTENLDTILAQSNQFNITSPSSTSSNSGASGTTVSVVPTAFTTPTTTGTGSSDSGSVSILPTTGSSSAAALSYSVQTGLLGLFSLLGFALA